MILARESQACRNLLDLDQGCPGEVDDHPGYPYSCSLASRFLFHVARRHRKTDERPVGAPVPDAGQGDQNSETFWCKSDIVRLQEWSWRPNGASTLTGRLDKKLEILPLVLELAVQCVDFVDIVQKNMYFRSLDLPWEWDEGRSDS